MPSSVNVAGSGIGRFGSSWLVPYWKLKFENSDRASSLVKLKVKTTELKISGLVVAAG